MNRTLITLLTHTPFWLYSLEIKCSNSLKWKVVCAARVFWRSIPSMLPLTHRIPSTSPLLVLRISLLFWINFWLQSSHRPVLFTLSIFCWKIRRSKSLLTTEKIWRRGNGWYHFQLKIIIKNYWVKCRSYLHNIQHLTDELSF